MVAVVGRERRLVNCLPAHQLKEMNGGRVPGHQAIKSITFESNGPVAFLLDRSLSGWYVTVPQL